MDETGPLGTLERGCQLLHEGVVEFGLQDGYGRVAGCLGPDLEAKLGLGRVGLLEMLPAKGTKCLEEIAGQWRRARRTPCRD